MKKRSKAGRKNISDTRLRQLILVLMGTRKSIGDAFSEILKPEDDEFDHDFHRDHVMEGLASLDVGRCRQMSLLQEVDVCTSFGN